jgi:hypothetical protein
MVVVRTRWYRVSGYFIFKEWSASFERTTHASNVRAETDQLTGKSATDFAGSMDRAVKAFEAAKQPPDVPDH